MQYDDTALDKPSIVFSCPRRQAEIPRSDLTPIGNSPLVGFLLPEIFVICDRHRGFYRLTPGDDDMSSRNVVTRSGQRIRGYFPSHKCGQMIAWESLLERDAILLLEFSQGVVSYRHQPFVIDYSDGEQMRKYYPDFEVVLEGGEVPRNTAGPRAGQVGGPFFAAVFCSPVNAISWPRSSAAISAATFASATSADDRVSCRTASASADCRRGGPC